MSDQIERVIRSLRHLWAQPDATIEQFAAEAVAALRPELEDAERWKKFVGLVCHQSSQDYYNHEGKQELWGVWFAGAYKHINHAIDAARQEGK